MRGETEDAFLCALGSRDSCAHWTGDVDPFRNSSAASDDVMRQWLDHEKNHHRMPRCGEDDATTATTTTTTTTTTISSNSSNGSRKHFGGDGVSSALKLESAGRDLVSNSDEQDHGANVGFSGERCPPLRVLQHDPARNARELTVVKGGCKGKVVESGVGRVSLLASYVVPACQVRILADTRLLSHT